MTYSEYVTATMRACKDNGASRYSQWFELDDISMAIELTTCQSYQAKRSAVENADIIRDNMLSILHELWSDMDES